MRISHEKVFGVGKRFYRNFFNRKFGSLFFEHVQLLYGIYKWWQPQLISKLQEDNHMFIVLSIYYTVASTNSITRKK